MSNSNDLISKLGITNSSKAYLLHAPEDYSIIFPDSYEVNKIKNLPLELEWVQAFYKDKLQLQKDMGSIKSKLTKSGQLWICWPKKSSKVSTNLNDQTVRDIGLNAGLVDVKVVSINDIWSGLKFIYRKSNR